MNKQKKGDDMYSPSRPKLAMALQIFGTLVLLIAHWYSVAGTSVASKGMVSAVTLRKMHMEMDEPMDGFDPTYFYSDEDEVDDGGSNSDKSDSDGDGEDGEGHGAEVEEAGVD